MSDLHSPTLASLDDDVLRPTYLEVDLGRLAANYATIQRQVAGRPVMVILKANAYGHGLVRVAQEMAQIGASYFGVAYLEEGLMLRQAGITTPILVMSGIWGNQIPHFITHDLTLAASSVEKLEQIDAAAHALGKQARVHLKFDTGMERIGVHYYNAETLLEASLQCKHCEIEGVFSHFANADTADLTHAYLQLERFNRILDFYTERNLPMPMRHIANSGAIINMPESWFDMVRAGILLYGIFPSDDVPTDLAITPALTWKSRVVYFKVVKPGHPVGYGSRWQSDEMVRVITLPIGYGDGYMRRMTGCAEVIVRGKKYPVVGGICMDQMMVNIGWETAYNNDEVILLGRDGASGATISAEMLAEWAGTNVYEVLTNINTRVPRKYIGAKK